MKKLSLFFACSLLAFSLFSQDEWTMIHPYPTLENLYDAYFVSEQKGWVVGTNGSIIYTENGGETWDFQHSNPDESFWGMHFVNEQEGWVVGWNKIYHTTNGGQDWNLQAHPGVMGDFTDVYFINPDTGWIVGTYQIILKTTNGGENWVKKSNTLAGDLWFHSVMFADAENGIAVGDANYEYGFVKVTHDGGDTWTETSPEGFDNFDDIEMIDSNTAWICGGGGALLKSVDGGHTWTDEYFDYSTFKDIHFYNQDTGILIGTHESFNTFDGGQSWNFAGYFHDGSGVNSMYGFQDGKGVAVNYFGDIYLTVNYGVDWQNLNRDYSSGIGKIGFFNEYDGITLTEYVYNGHLGRTNDGGYTWYTDTLLDFGNLRKFYMKDSLCYLINDSSQLFKTTNGIDWTIANAPDTTSYWWDFQFVDENVGFLSGGGGMLFRTIDGGNTWTDISIIDCGNLVSIFFFNENNGWVIDYENKALMKTVSGGVGWSYKYLGSPDHYQPRDLFFTSESIGYVTTKEGFLFKTINGGNTWFEQYSFNIGSNSNIYFINEDEGWYENGYKIYHTQDGGLNWFNEQSFGTALVTDIFFMDNDHGWLSGSSSLVARYSSTVNIPEPEEVDKNISLYPNPATNELNVELLDENNKILEVEIFEIHGLRILNLPHQMYSSTLKLNISKLVPGVYIANIKTSKDVYSSKFIKK